MIGILCLSILSSVIMTGLLKTVGSRSSKEVLSGSSSATQGSDKFQDGAARRELQQRGFGRFWGRVLSLACAR